MADLYEVGKELKRNIRRHWHSVSGKPKKSLFFRKSVLRMMAEMYVVDMDLDQSIICTAECMIESLAERVPLKRYMVTRKLFVRAMVEHNSICFHY
jgi:hypothetical protein